MLREYLEKNHRDGMNVQETIRLAVETLMEVVESSKNIEINVTYPDNRHESLDDETIDRIVKQIEKEREDEAAAKAGGAGKA